MKHFCFECGYYFDEKPKNNICPVCHRNTRYYPKAHELNCEYNSIYLRWLQNIILGSERKDRGILLLQTTGSMGKSAFFRHIAYNREERFSYEDIHLLLCDTSGTMVHCLSSMQAVLENYGKKYASDFMIETALSDEAPKQLCNILTNLRNLQLEHGVSSPLVLVLDGADADGNLFPLLRLLPKEEELPSQVFILISCRTPQSLTENQRLNNTPFVDRMITSCQDASYLSWLEKNIVSQLFHNWLPQKLSSQKVQFRFLMEHTDGQWILIQVMQQLLQDYGNQYFFTLPAEHPVKILLSLKATDDPDFQSHFRILLFLSVLRIPIYTEYLFSEDSTDEQAETFYSQYYSLLSVHRKDGRTTIAICNEALKKTIREFYPDDIAQIVDSFLEVPLNAKDGISPMEYICASFLFDVVEHCGTDEQKLRLYQTPEIYDPLPLHQLICKTNDHSMLYKAFLFDSERIAGLKYSKIPNKEHLIAELYFSRNEIDEKSGALSQQIEDCKSTLRYLSLVSHFSQRDIFLLLLTYQTLARLYQKKEQFSDALSYLGKAIALIENHFSERNVSLVLKVSELYQLHGTWNLQIDQLDSAKNDYEKSIRLLRKLPEQGFATASAYAQIGKFFFKKDRLSDSSEYFSKSIHILQFINDKSTAEWKENASSAYSLLANVQIKQGKYSDALESLTKVVDFQGALLSAKLLKIPLSLAKNYSNRGSVYSLLNRDEDAFSDYGKAISICAEYFNRNNYFEVLILAKIYLSRSILLRKYGKTMEEIMECSHGIRLLSDKSLQTKINQREFVSVYAKLCRLRGEGYQKIGNTDMAQKDLLFYRHLHALEKRYYSYEQ